MLAVAGEAADLVEKGDDNKIDFGAAFCSFWTNGLWDAKNQTCSN